MTIYEKETPMSKKKAAPRRAQADGPQASPAAAAPSDLLRMEEAIAILKTTRPTFYRWLRANKIKAYKVGRQWRFLKDDLERFLKGRQPRIDLPVSPAPLVAALEDQLRQLGPTDLAGPFEDDPLSRAVWLAVRLALAQRASDIHLAPHYDGKERSAMLRNRIDGALHEAARFDLRLLPALVARVKTLAGMNPAESQQPQDGRILMTRDRHGVEVDVRVCTLPAVMGESVTCRLLVAEAINFDIERFGYNEADKKKIQEAARAAHGLVIVNGPTGSGKTTTLYACLAMSAGPAVKTMTVEDPVEYLLPWMVQVGLDEQAGMTFPRCIRAVLRSDPDVIMVGEIRSPEIAGLCAQCALTGHLVFTTLHSNDSAHALQRMVELGVPAFVLADAALLVLSQKLVRKLCPHCSRPAEIPREQEPSRVGPAGLSIGPAALSRQQQSQAVELAVRGGIAAGELGNDYRQPVGCKECGNIGYRGRMVLAETLRVGPEVSRCLRAGAPAEEIRRAAVAEGMTTMEADGIQKASKGVTTLEEVCRTLSLGAVS
jgi:excisionase family DNA binding protein